MPAIDVANAYYLRWYNPTMTATTIEDALSRLKKLPVAVKRWEVDEGTDATGDPAVWVWAFVDDENLADKEGIVRLRQVIKDAVANASKALAPWVYVRFRATSEE